MNFNFICDYNYFFKKKIGSYSLIKISLKYSHRYNDIDAMDEPIGITFYFVILGIGFSISKRSENEFI